MEISSIRSQGTLVYSRRLYNFVDENFVVVSILFYEFWGTLFFSYGVLTGLNGNFTYSPFMAGTFSSVWIPMCLYMMICYAGRFTGGQFNPAVTFAHMLKRKNRLPPIQGLLYFAAEFLGAIVGSGIAFWVNGSQINGAPWILPLPADSYSNVLDAFRGQIFGTFLLVFFVIVSSDPATTPCGPGIQGNIFVPMCLMCARIYSYRLQGLNPAFAIGFQLFYCIKFGYWQVWQYVWSNFFGPFIGSILAILFFQFVYKKFLWYYLNRPKIVQIKTNSNRISLQEAELF